MAQVMHARNDSGVSVNSFVLHESPPSPTLTNPDMIVPLEPWQTEPSYESDEGPHPLLEPEVPLSQTLSDTTISTKPSVEEMGIATAVLMPSRVSVRPPTTIHGPATPIPTYTGYEHGAPLSDIYEESEANATPTSRSGRRSRTPSPTPVDEAPPTPTRPTLRHKKRTSELSSSSGGSDVGDWENFDSSKVLSSRVAADLAQLRREDNIDVDDATSRRASREEEELAALNARAEKILENARKRLTHMEDNLKFARNSIIIPQRSPNLGGEHQPVGGLYRSISAAGASKLAKSRQIYPTIKTSTSLQHMRGNSETGVPAPPKRFSRQPDIRSASALEYGSPAKYSLFPDNTSSATRVQPSPASSRSYNSPLRPLQEEDRNSPSTAETTPESVKVPLMRGLGINTAAAISRDILVSERSGSRQTPTPTQLNRASSSASIRSAKELKDQMSDLKSRIADLRSTTQADQLRRQGLQSLHSSSPFANALPEQWYASSPVYEEPGSPINADSGVGWRSSASPTAPEGSGFKDSIYDEHRDTDFPTTPANSKYLDVDRMSPTTAAHLMSSARTDRNTPSLARAKAIPNDDDDDDDVASVIHASQANDPTEDDDAEEDDETDEQVAESEEEQIYLNEMLEESLRDAEVEPEVPTIPGSYLETPDVPVLGPEAQRHEDRLDAFDYENMFLHSAMGTYMGKSLNGSDSCSENSDDGGSVETETRARTPQDESDEQDEPTTDEEIEGIVVGEKSPEFSLQSTPHIDQHQPEQKQLGSPPRTELPQPPMPWVHARSKSMDSVSSIATFETATEGAGYNDTPNEILNWGPPPSSSIRYSPSSHQAYRQQNSPMRARHGFSSPQSGGRPTPLATRTPNSPLRSQAHYEIHYDRETALQSPGLGLGVIGGENAQFINDNGVPARFQGQHSPIHSRQSSLNTLQQSHIRPESQATIVNAASPSRGHQRQYSARQAPLTPNGRGSPTVVTVTNSPQRKVVINRSLQQPQSFIFEPQFDAPPPPSGPLPEPPASSKALQAQIASPKKITVSRSHSQKNGRPGSAQSKTTPPPPVANLQSVHKLQTPPPPPLRHEHDAAPSPAPPSSSSGPISNTENLMESLIKLADPSFSLPPGISFEEVDKELVLNLLGAVGGVCNSILRASVQSGSPALRRTQAEGLIQMLRERMGAATGVLEGQEFLRQA